MFRTAEAERRAEFLRMPRPAAIPTREEVGILLQAATVQPRDYLLMRLLYATGVRVGEVVALRWADVNWDELTIFVRDGKGDKDRYVLVDPTTLRLLAERKGESTPEMTLFGIKARAADKQFRKFARQTGLFQKYGEQGLGLAPHSFRHAFATHSYENGMDVYSLQALLGHEFLSTTYIYIKTARTDERAAYDASTIS